MRQRCSYLPPRFLLIIFILIQQSSFAVEGPYEHSIETAHLRILWNTADASATEVRRFKVEAETIYKSVMNTLGEKRAPVEKITIILDGSAKLPGKPPRTPFTEPSRGWVHLFRYTSSDYAYHNGLSHELTHAYRFEEIKKHDKDKSTGFGFVEEGLAEYVSVLVEPNKPFFSTYGMPLNVIASYWMSEEKAIPLLKLLNQYSELDQKCLVQAYPLRASFIQYLDITFGRAALLGFAFSREAVNLALFKHLFGKEFLDLERDWKAYLIKSTAMISDLPAMREHYRNAYIQKSMYICTSGKDF